MSVCIDRDDHAQHPHMEDYYDLTLFSPAKPSRRRNTWYSTSGGTGVRAAAARPTVRPGTRGTSGGKTVTHPPAAAHHGAAGVQTFPTPKWRPSCASSLRRHFQHRQTSCLPRNRSCPRASRSRSMPAVSQMRARCGSVTRGPSSSATVCSTRSMPSSSGTANAMRKSSRRGWIGQMGSPFTTARCTSPRAPRSRSSKRLRRISTTRRSPLPFMTTYPISRRTDGGSLPLARTISST